MEFRPLMVTVNSAEGLKDLRHAIFGTMDVYVVVSLSGDDRNQNKQQTRVHQDGGTDPRWDHAFSFNVDEAAARSDRLTLEFEIKDENTVRGHMDVGRVDVPVKELLKQGGGAGNGEPKVMRYSVRLPSGETKGVLEFSYKFGERFTMTTPPEAKNEPVTAAPAAAASSSSSSAAGCPPSAGRSYPPQGYGYPPPVYQTPPAEGGFMAGLMVVNAISANMIADASSYEAGYDDGLADADV